MLKFFDWGPLSLNYCTDSLMQSLLFITITGGGGGLEILAFISTEKRVYMVFYSVDAYFVWQKVSPNIKFSRVPGMVKFLLC